MNKLYAFLFSLLAALAVSGCSSPLTQRSDAVPASGTGTVRVNFSRSEARTIVPIPPADLSVFDRLEYRFAKDGGAEAAETPQNGVFVLDAGSYTLTVNAYMSAGTGLAASGTAGFTVTAGADASVSLTLQPVISGGGTGTFKYALAYPGGAAVESLSLTRLTGSEPIDLRDGAVPAEAGLSGEQTVGVGYYLFTVSLSLAKADGTRIQRRAEVVHIYENMTAETATYDYTFTEGHFEGDLFVISAADTGAGTLRDALSKAAVGTAIHVDLPAGSEIALESGLSINKNLTIEGNSLTLTRAASWTTVNDNSQLLRILSGSTVTIRRVHFKDGRTSGSGGAVYSEGSLTLESCIFSGNQATGNGGAVASGVAAQGCTFYNNSSAASGGAIYGGGSLTGNLFYGNTAASGSGHVVFGYVTSNGYNVADRPKGTGFTSGESGFNHTADVYSNAPALAPLTFKVLSGSGAEGIIASLPEVYPAADFYGQPITAGASAGAVQAVAADGYAVMTSTNSSSGSISVAGTPPNADGLYTGSVSLTAAGTGSYTFARWLVDGADRGTANPLELTLTGHVTVHAEFKRTVTSNADAGAGTLRQALTDAVNGDIITMGTANQTIELASALPEVSKNITIEGNSLTLTRAASWTAVSSYSQLLRISYGTVSIRRVHFKDGQASGSDGGAVYNNGGNLTLESCIFSGNRAAGSSASGGAVYNSGNLTVRGCTFYNNTAWSGGAIYRGFGTVTLSGNLFYGNTSASGSGHVVYGDVTSAGYNVADKPKGTGYSSGQSGFNHTDDVYSNAPALAPLTFKVLSGSGADGIITTLPADYPAADFYGQPITAGASAGAVQAAAAGYAVITSTNGGSISIAGTSNADGLYTGSVSLTAAGTGGYTFARWLVDGADRGTANPLVLTLTGHVTVHAEFKRMVTSNADAGAGTLRQALTDAVDGDIITMGTANQTIELARALPEVRKSITIEGNSLTLIRGGSDIGGLLLISNGTAVSIRRVHFKDGRAERYGGAVYTLGNLTLESCIFSGNQTAGSSSSGGAVYNAGNGNLTVRGCTFYNNTSYSGSGGAIYRNGGTVTLSGNLFYGNTLGGGYVVYGDVTSAGYNVADWPKGTGIGQSGFNHADDRYSNVLTLAPLNFKVLSGSGAQGIIATLPADYPAADFYGQPITAGASAGAVQAVAAGGYAVATSTNNSGGSISVAGTPNGDGLYTGSVSLTPVALAGGYTFTRWLVDGADRGTANPLEFTLDSHVTVRAEFSRTVTVTSNADAGAGTLRQALTDAGDIITMGTANQTIALASALPQVSKNITVEGNSLTLTRAASWTAVSYDSQLLNISNRTVTIRRVHFKNGRSSSGGAVRNQGNLTLESCIFSGNQATGTGSGGAVYTSGNLTVRGCTFYSNTAGFGGAIYQGSSGTITLTGNLFYGNTAASDSNGHVVYGSVTSAGYNVADKPKGTGSGKSGFNHENDSSFDVLSISGDPLNSGFAPVSGLGTFITSAPADFPAVDFYGVTRTWPGAPGAAATVQ